MDYQMIGDRPIDHFELSSGEYQEFISSGAGELCEPPDEAPYYEYKGIRVDRMR